VIHWYIGGVIYWYIGGVIHWFVGGVIHRARTAQCRGWWVMGYRGIARRERVCGGEGGGGIRQRRQRQQHSISKGAGAMGYRGGRLALGRRRGSLGTVVRMFTYLIIYFHNILYIPSLRII
jgi:hypothetical protein